MIRLSTTLLGSLLGHLAVVIAALYGSWEAETTPLRAISEYVVHTERVATIQIAVPEQAASTVAPLAPTEKEEVEQQEAPEVAVVATPEKTPEVRDEPPPLAEKIAVVPEVKEDAVKDAPEEPAKVPVAMVSSPAGEAPAQEHSSIAVVSAPSAAPGGQGSNPLAQPAASEPVAVSRGRASQRDEAGLGGGVDRAGLFKAYRKKVFLAVDRRKSIPLAARRARMTGTVYVVVTLDATGRILTAKVRKSSGHKLLDETALATVLGIGVMPRPPEALAWTQKKLTIPIRYTT